MMVSLNKMITLLLLLASSLISLHLFPPTIHGRVVANVCTTTVSVSTTSRCPEVVGKEKEEEEKKVVVRGKMVMGSRPPRCEGRCGSCGGHCEAVQVPSSLSSNTKTHYAPTTTTTTTTTGTSHQLSYPDYKPITWKCQCSPSL